MGFSLSLKTRLSNNTSVSCSEVTLILIKQGKVLVPFCLCCDRPEKQWEDIVLGFREQPVQGWLCWGCRGGSGGVTVRLRTRD